MGKYTLNHTEIYIKARSSHTERVPERQRCESIARFGGSALHLHVSLEEYLFKHICAAFKIPDYTFHNYTEAEARGFSLSVSPNLRKDFFQRISKSKH